MDFLWFILIGLVAGALAGMIMRGGGFGIVGDIVVGVVGALIGGALFQALGISAGGGLLSAIIVATIGAVVLIAILRFLRRVGN
ncbi:MAG: GlsB/YeaQ/YmgE family stress response membrane protein [Planctomycetota bacterium]